MLFNSTIFFIAYLLLTSISVYCLLNLFVLNTTFKILLNILCFIMCNSLTLILLGIDFLGIVYAIVYAGAILVLFLSVLMLVDLRAEDTAEIILTKAQKKNTPAFFLQYLVLFVYICSISYIYMYITTFYTMKDENLLEINSEVPTSISVFHTRSLIYWISEIVYTSEVALFLAIGGIFFLSMIGSISLILNETQKISSAINLTIEIPNKLDKESAAPDEHKK